MRACACLFINRYLSTLISPVGPSGVPGVVTRACPAADPARCALDAADLGAFGLPSGVAVRHAVEVPADDVVAFVGDEALDYRLVGAAAEADPFKVYRGAQRRVRWLGVYRDDAHGDV
jgi:hypothetical protein